MVAVNTLYYGDNQRECYLTVLRWAKLEGFDVVTDPAYADIIGLGIEVDAAMDWLAEHVPDYDYELDSSEGYWAFIRMAFDRSVVECG